MKTHFPLAAVVWLCGALVVGAAAPEGAKSTNAISPSWVTATAASSNAPVTPGVEAAQAISTITGVAISPLLGVGGVGAWKWWKATPARRAALPWYAQPWFWMPALSVIMLVLLKDVVGTSMPTAFKKPFDVLELFENKISALVAAGAFVPLIATIFRSASDGDTSVLQSMGLAFIDPLAFLNVLIVPLAVAAFLAVWLVAHVINVLILISPFGAVDVALKAARVFLMTTIAATTLAHPYVGALLSLVIIGVSLLLAGWAFRMTFFGNVFAWDLLTLRHRRFTVAADKNPVFLARRLGKVPVRTWGRLTQDPCGNLAFEYRPWLVLARRLVTLPEGRFTVGRGLLYPEVVQLNVPFGRSTLTLPPRYLGHEEEFSSVHRLDGVQDVGLLKGFKALWSWARGLFTAQRLPATQGS